MRFATIGLAVCSICSQVTAQDYPNPQPQTAHKVLADEVGTWDTVVKMYLQGPAAPPTEYHGVETVKLVSGGLYSQSEFKCQMGERQFEGHGLLGYDPRSKEYTGLWVDNFSEVPTQVKGTYDSEKKSLTMFSAVVDTATGNELKQKQITTFVDDETKTFEIFLILQAGDQQTDVKIMEMTAKKRQ